MSHRHCCTNHGGNGLLCLAALIGFVLLAFGRCKGTIYAALIILAVLIICGCKCGCQQLLLVQNFKGLMINKY